MQIWAGTPKTANRAGMPHLAPGAAARASTPGHHRCVVPAAAAPRRPAEPRASEPWRCPAPVHREEGEEAPPPAAAREGWRAGEAGAGGARSRLPARGSGRDERAILHA
ncbi:hypothetical protein ZWY2020_022921 [Hordeum vulgare]|nr:hypothetical protein ZWY2020_022921 [Hordeum vulgare]